MTQLWRFRGRFLLPQALTLLFAATPVASLAIIASGTARAADLLQPANDDFNGVFDKAKTSVVQVRSGDLGFVSAGSGFFIDDQGTVLTSSTILGENKNARVVINGVEWDAKIVGNDPFSGLAMLRISYDQAPALTLAKSTDVKTGNNVLMLGYPMSLPVAASEGQVSGFDSSYLSKIPGDTEKKSEVAAVIRFATSHIHANLSVSPGQVGGPLLNTRGEVIGLAATSPDGGRTIYGLPTEAMTKVIADFNAYGHARHGWVGIKVLEAPDTAHDGRTVRVVQVVPGTPASKSGINPGDTVMRIDNREIYRPSDVLDASFFSKVGGNMTVVVRRDDKLYNYSFAVIERPENNSAPVNPAVRGSTTDSSPAGKIIQASKVVADRK